MPHGDSGLGGCRLAAKLHSPPINQTKRHNIPAIRSKARAS